MGLKTYCTPSSQLLQSLRHWLFLFCQCRSGQYLIDPSVAAAAVCPDTTPVLAVRVDGRAKQQRR